MSDWAVKLFGAKLVDGKSEVDTESALAGKTAVAIYFSAHWCGPCRGFTPKLVETYEKLAKSKPGEFEIVFASSDRDDPAFAEYFGEMPWKALPFADRDAKNKLSKKYKVNGIPSLIILDGKTGETIAMDGRTAVMSDPNCEKFPWKPPTIWEALGDEFLAGDGETVELSSIRGPGKVIGIYFSAHWCPPCKGFTPKLAEAYKALKAQGKEFEIIFVSSDRSMQDFQSYFAEHPWIAIPQGDKRKDVLSQLFEVEGIPTFVTIDGETGKTINANARGAISDLSAFPWYPAPVNDLASPEGINETTSFCLMMEGCNAEVQKAAEETLTTIAKAALAAEEDMIFFVAKSAEGAVPQVRKLMKLGEPAATPTMLLVDIPDNGGFYVQPVDSVTAEGITGFLAKYKAGALERKQIGQ